MILVRHGESFFNAAFKKNRVDPLLRDPALTDQGREEASRAAAALAALAADSGRPFTRLIASPYRRGLETAAPIAARLGLAIEIDAWVGERAVFHCDLGTRRRDLQQQFPAICFDGLEEFWWPAPVESEAALVQRCRAFCARMAARDDWQTTIVVTHWGVARGLLGKTLLNGETAFCDPTDDREMTPGIDGFFQRLLAAASSNTEDTAPAPHT